MTRKSDTEFDLTTSRIIRAPRSLVWSAWADPVSFAQWWIPAPTRCKVVAMELRPGGAFVTEMSENGGALVPHLKCLLPRRRRGRKDRLQRCADRRMEAGGATFLHGSHHTGGSSERHRV